MTVDVANEAEDVAVPSKALAAEDTAAVLVAAVFNADPEIVAVLLSLELAEEVLLSPVIPQTSCSLVQPVANSPAHQNPLDINQ